MKIDATCNNKPLKVTKYREFTSYPPVVAHVSIYMSCAVIVIRFIISARSFINVIVDGEMRFAVFAHDKISKYRYQCDKRAIK